MPWNRAVSSLGVGSAPLGLAGRVGLLAFVAPVSAGQGARRRTSSDPVSTVALGKIRSGLGVGVR